MIVGIGTDLVDIQRIERTLMEFGDRFTHRVFTDAEREKADERPLQGRNSRASTYAKRYAAKEACAKALGLGIGQSASWQDISVLNAPSGLPHLYLKGAAQKRLQELVPAPMVPQVHLSLTDEGTFAHATVIISAAQHL